MKNIGIELCTDMCIIDESSFVRTIYIESQSLDLLIPFILRRLRERNNLTIREVADRLGHKSHTAYARYESGKVKASLDKLAKYVKAIDEENDLILKVG